MAEKARKRGIEMLDLFVVGCVSLMDQKRGLNEQRVKLSRPGHVHRMAISSNSMLSLCSFAKAILHPMQERTPSRKKASRKDKAS